MKRSRDAGKRSKKQAGKTKKRQGGTGASPRATPAEVLRLLETGDKKPALHLLERALKEKRGTVSQWIDLTKALKQRDELAIASLAVGVARQLDPEDPHAKFFDGLMLHNRGNYQSAIRLMLDGCQGAPDRLDYKVQLGQTLMQAGHLDQSEAIFRLVLKHHADNIWAKAGLATVLVRKDRAQEAYDLTLPHIRGNNVHVNMLSTFAQACKLLKRSAEAIEPLETALTQVSDLHSRVLIGHNLGDSYVATKSYDKAFEAYAAANSERQHRYSPTLWTESVDEIIKAHPEGFLKDRKQSTTDGSELVFIVGMPRSGTSLTEQILASHPGVLPLGERSEVQTLAAAMGRSVDRPGANWATCVAELPQEKVNQMAEWLLANFKKSAAPGETPLRITDKMPDNYLYLGLIAQLFPKARIIHCVRDPVDTCLSNFFQNFGGSLQYSTRLEWTGRRFADYERVTAHWEKVVPNPIFRMEYDRFVEEPEVYIRKLVEFVGLPWDDACLKPHENTRTVNTASFAQVRKPINRSSKGRSEAYAKHLGPLFEALSYHKAKEQAA